MSEVSTETSSLAIKKNAMTRDLCSGKKVLKALLKKQKEERSAVQR